MKRIKNIFFIAIIALTAGCTDFLTTKPNNSSSDEQIFSTVKGADAAYNGAFKTLMEWYNSFAFPGYRSIQIMVDVAAEDVNSFSSYGSPWSQYRHLITNSYTSGTNSVIWSKYYATIDQSNIIIERLKSRDDKEYSEILGQAYFLRAFSYFDLVRLYQFTYISHKDKLVCPIYTTPMTLGDEGNPLSSVSDVYSQITADLDMAENLLKDYRRPDKDRPDLNIVRGLKARVYLTMENWEEAEKNAKMAREGYDLMSGADFSRGFNDRANSEWMYMFGQSSDQGDMSYSFHFLDNNISPVGSAFYSSMRPDPYWVQLLEENDIRRKNMISWDETSGDALGYVKYQKFRFKSAINLIGDLVLMRSAEMYLIEAEAIARNDSKPTTSSESVINELRASRNATLFTGLTREKLVEEILLERRRELWGEGFAIYDVLRTQRAIDRKSILKADNSYYDEILVGMPIPEKNGEPIKIKGHLNLKFPDLTNFIVNSPYYIFTVPEREVINNPNIERP